jgi:hypothetical protein
MDAMAAGIDPPDPPLRAEGLLLRPWTPGDVTDLLRIVATPDIPRWTGSMSSHRALA